MNNYYYIRKNKARRDIVYALIISILIHILLLVLVLINPDLLNLQSRKLKKPDKDYIEITEFPVPKDKETEPPKKTTLLAERSHKAKKESAPDKTTRLSKKSSARPVTPKKPSPPKKPPEPKETVKVEKEEVKVNKEVLRDHKLSSLPQQKWLRKKKSDEELKKKIEELAKSSPRDLPSPSQSTLPPMVGARNVPKTEDTVDLNTTEFKYYSYFLGLKKQIEGVWHYPRDAALRGEHGRLNLIFTISSNGDLEGIQIVHSSGYASLDNEALRAIKVASPFHPFPKSWGKLEKLNVKATFEYTYRQFLR